MSSSRLPGKVLRPLSGMPLVVLCAKRLGLAGNRVVVLTSDDKSDDDLVEVLRRYNIENFRGSLNDVLDRFARFSSRLPDNQLLIRATADNPVVDGLFINCLIAGVDFNTVNYVSVDFNKSKLPFGLGAEAFLVKTLHEADRYAQGSYNREHVTPYIYQNKDRFNLYYPDLFPFLSSVPRFSRCTIDTLEDYLVMQEIFAARNWYSSWEDLLSQPAIRGCVE